MPRTDCKPQVAFGFHRHLPVEAVFDAPEVSSDGGLLLLRETDDRLGLSRWFAACLPDARAAERVEHDRLEQVRQRVLQIAMGYEDCNDADTLRHDPILKTACDRSPRSRGLSSQPTLSRFENSVDGRALNRLRAGLEQSYVEGLPPETETVVLDIDTTDDATHGEQQLTFFHGFYDQHMYHPLLVFDGTSGDIVSVLLRPGNAHAARSARSLLCRLVRRIKARFPRAQVVIRGDSGFCMPRILDALEALDAELGGVDYIIGIAKNARLLKLAEPIMAQAAEHFAETRAYVRHFATTTYAAETWSRERHVVIKAEHQAKGENPRFVVTTLNQFPGRLIYDRGYCARGQAENFIKDLKNALAADRLSCCRFVANFLRLLLHAAAYRLMHAVRTAAKTVDPELGRAQFDTLRLRLLKVAAHVTQSARRILVRLPAAFPAAQVFVAVAHYFAPPAPA